jgi:hypothetical protein
MIKIMKTSNSTITVTDTETGGVVMILGKDCEVMVFDDVNMYMPQQMRTRTVGIYNKYNQKIIAIVNATTLDPTSTNYSVDMNTYSTNLRDLILYV